MNITLNLNSKEYQDLTKYCELNKLIPEDIVKKSYLEGFMIEKYELLGNTGGVQEKEVVKEVIKYIEVPVVEEKEVIKIEYVEVEKIIEKKIEVPVEKIVYVHEKTEEPTSISDNTCDKFKIKLEQIQRTVLNLQQTIIQKDNEISNLTKTLREIEQINSPIKVQFMRTSNLDDNLYKK
jgi:hypothetical protein